ncbi:MAG: diacylglycerol kinase family protein [Bacteroidota bacterium]
MKVAQIFHNTNAGHGILSKKELLSLIAAAGYEAIYSAVKKGKLPEFDNNADFVVAAGGDGTINKVVKKVLKRKILDRQLPVAIIPLGTANNLNITLQERQDLKEILESWHAGHTKRFDVGVVTCSTDQTPFIEGVGVGLIPLLIREMSKHKEADDLPPAEQISFALRLLRDIARTFRPQECKVVIDGVDYTGKYLAVEIMNIRSVGPRLDMNPDGDVGDGKHDVVLIRDVDREQFEAYVTAKINGTDVPLGIMPIRAASVDISWSGTHAHIDDKVIKDIFPMRLITELRPGPVSFLVP